MLRLLAGVLSSLQKRPRQTYSFSERRADLLAALHRQRPSPREKLLLYHRLPLGLWEDAYTQAFKDILGASRHKQMFAIMCQTKKSLCWSSSRHLGRPDTPAQPAAQPPAQGVTEARAGMAQNHPA